jgi:hypothetical protein
VELAVGAAHQRHGEPVWVVDEVVGEAPLDAQVAVVDRGARRRAGDLDHLVGLPVDVQVELAADAAEVAGGPHLLELVLRLAVEEGGFLDHRPGGADVDAAAAHLAGGIGQRPAVGGGDRGLAAAARQGDRVDRLDLVAVARAQPADDAVVRAVGDEAVDVLRPRGAWRPYRSEVPGGAVDVGQRVHPVRIDVLGLVPLLLRVGHVERQDEPPVALDLGGVGAHHHARLGRESARGLHQPRPLDFDQAHPAGAGRVDPVVVAQRRDVDPHPPRGGQDGLPLPVVQLVAVQDEEAALGVLHVAHTGILTEGRPGDFPFPIARTPPASAGWPW